MLSGISQSRWKSLIRNLTEKSRMSGRTEAETAYENPVSVFVCRHERGAALRIFSPEVRFRGVHG